MKVFQLVSALLLSLAWMLPSEAQPNGEEACENKGFDVNECNDVGCCFWDGEQCWSDVGQNPCEARPPLLDGYVGWRDNGVVWSDPPNLNWNGCEKVTVVFGIPVCITEKAWPEQVKRDHIVHVFYQLIDNNADGQPDDPKILSEMVNGNYLLLITRDNSELDSFFNDFNIEMKASQPVQTSKTFPDSCDFPINRGASPTDRSTWPRSVDTSEMNCQSGRCEAFEEIHHLINVAATILYPSKWATTFESEVGALLKEANGNCGWGYEKNWIDPSTNGCSGTYAYNDETCDESCLVIEGTYWASITYVGGLYTSERTESISNEWLMGTPDNFMEVYPKGVTNAVSLETGSPALYAMVSDTTSEGHAWLPEVMTDGHYKGFDNNVPSPPTQAPTRGATPTQATPTSAPTRGATPTQAPTSATTSSTTSGCVDDEDFRFKNKKKKSYFRFKNKKKKSCEKWVAKNANKLHKKKFVRAMKKKCRKKFKNKHVWDYCPKTCALVGLGDCA
ncbi:unnamed protein product [Pseudo-nitzschia multistriata]|uniref:LNR domain-containing protein n=1 Tax=Pseudo-nitzschia multistriata TaxID=183589 RepID=A0A448ZAC0_9STRA|nr:unnamed protein product [Pseudo-nitzschia multistriata]